MLLRAGFDVAPLASPRSKRTKFSCNGVDFYISNENGVTRELKALPVHDRSFGQLSIVCSPTWDGNSKLQSKGFINFDERRGSNLVGMSRTTSPSKWSGTQYNLALDDIEGFIRVIIDNLHSDRTSAEALNIDVDSGSNQGYESNAELRVVIEKYAMDRAISYYQSKGRVVVVGKPYDIDCHSPDGHFRVEVKGTRSVGDKVIVTRNEVRHALEGEIRVELFLVSGIEVTFERSMPRAHGGNAFVVRNWKPKADELEPTEFLYRFPLDAEHVNL